MLGETEIGLLPGTCFYGFKLYLFFTPPMTGARELAGLPQEPPVVPWGPPCYSCQRAELSFFHCK